MSQSVGRRRFRVQALRAALLGKVEALLAPEALGGRVADLSAASPDGWLPLAELNRVAGPLLHDQRAASLLDDASSRAFVDLCAGSEVVESSGLRVRTRMDGVPSEARTIYVDGLKPSVGADWLSAQFSPAGLVTQIRIPKPRLKPTADRRDDGKRRSVVSQNRGFAFITFASRKAAEKAAMLNKVPDDREHEGKEADTAEPEPTIEGSHEPVPQTSSESKIENAPEINEAIVTEVIAAPIIEETDQVPDINMDKSDCELAPPASDSRKRPRESDADAIGPKRARISGPLPPTKKKARGKSRAQKSAQAGRHSDLRHRRETQALTVLSHADWARLKAEYLALQKAAASRLKASVPSSFVTPAGTHSRGEGGRKRRGRDQLLARAAAFRASLPTAAPPDERPIDLDNVD